MRLSETTREKYERICTWVQQLNGEYDNKEVTHSHLLEEAREIGVAVIALCNNTKKWISLLAK